MNERNFPMPDLRRRWPALPGPCCASIMNTE